MKIEHLGVFVGTRNFFYDHAVSNSPLVERSAIIQVFLGAGYYF